MDQRTIEKMLQEMQGSIERNFGRVTERLDRLENKVADIEEKHNRFESLHATPPSSASSESPGDNDRSRNRRSPPELQVG
jgi:hypothetical protein